MTRIAAEKIVKQILDGNADEELDIISQALRTRREQLDGQKSVFLRQGDTVVFNERAKPKYLQGVEATVLRVLRTRAELEMPAIGRFKGEKVRAPFAIIDKV